MITPTSGDCGWTPLVRHNSLMWIPVSSGDPLPRGAVRVGIDKYDIDLYAGRAFHEGDLLPAKINPTHEAAYVCSGGKEHPKCEYEVLCHACVAWQRVPGHIIPSNAIVMGTTAEGENLYMGRTLHDGTLTPGKVQPSQKVLKIPYNGQEICFNEYEIMIFRQP